MRLIEKLLHKAKNRPKYERVGNVIPWDNKWYFTLLSKKKGESERLNREFDCKADALEYAKSIMKDDETLNVVSFVNMDMQEVPFTTEDKRRAAGKCD